MYKIGDIFIKKRKYDGEWELYRIDSSTGINYYHLKNIESGKSRAYGIKALNETFNLKN